LRRPKHSGNPWPRAGFVALTALALVAIVLRQPAGSGAPAAPATAPDAPPDISGLGPRQRFDTLFNVVMRASENGDASRATRFAPMAFMAYAQLDEVDADARYHAAVLRLQVEGSIQPALALADTILALQPRHLFGYMIRGSAGQLSGDQRMVQRAAADFLAALDAELASGKPEYQDHRIMLDQFRARALKLGSGAKP
jgi:hypothetical protein